MYVVISYCGLIDFVSFMLERISLDPFNIQPATVTGSLLLQLQEA